MSDQLIHLYRIFPCKQLMVSIWKTNSEPLGSWYRCFTSPAASNSGDSCSSFVPNVLITSPSVITTSTGLTMSVWGLDAVLASQWAQDCLCFNGYDRFLSTQPRTVKREISGRTGTSASGATTAVPLPALSPASTPSHWPAPCSVWRAAMHTAPQVSHLPWVVMDGGMGGWDSFLGKVIPCPISSQPCPVVPDPQSYNPGSCLHMSFLQSQASYDFCQIELLFAYLLFYCLEQHFKKYFN